LGKIFLQEITHGYCRFPRHFPRNIVGANGILGVIRAYLDDLLCISKHSPEDHLEKLEVILRQLCNVGLKVNAEKLTFCEIEYLGYVLTRDGIKP
jgi:hypothetical protein